MGQILAVSVRFIKLKKNAKIVLTDYIFYIYRHLLNS